MDKSNIINNIEIKASILEPTEENIAKCGKYLREGGIVGMPTETVYGLAANAFDVSACDKIFIYKGRPLTDPLIVHVSSIEMVKQIALINSENTSLFTVFSNKFWPGPLTIILEANLSRLNPKILANSNTVGIRFPNNTIAQKLIAAAGVPLAAPSANKFSHISPVNPHHVYEDFKEFPVMILNGGVCNFCMESTVMKIDSKLKKVTVFRMGAVSPDQIQTELLNNHFDEYTVECLANKKVDIPKGVITDKEYTVNQEAPGQFLKHYSPKVDTFIFSEDENDNAILVESNFVFIDYTGILYAKYNKVVAKENFLELSIEGKEEEVMKNLYDYLRKAETIEGTRKIIICDLSKHMKANQHKLTLMDRMFKAASFKKVNIKMQ